MAELIAVYRTPRNADAFNAYYFAKHAALAKTMPGLRSYQASDGAVGLPVEPGGVHLVAILGFDSVDAIRQGPGTPQGEATAADLASFADDGVDLMVCDAKDV